MITSRKPVTVSIAKKIPEQSTPVKPTCHGMPIVSTTVKAKKAFSPMPGARPIGYLAISPINKEPTKAAKAVATKIAPWSIFMLSDTPLTPARLNTCGLTAKM